MVRRASRVRAIRHQLQREFYARWEEGKHPRDEDGQFSTKPGAKKTKYRFVDGAKGRSTLQNMMFRSVKFSDPHGSGVPVSLSKKGRNKTTGDVVTGMYQVTRQSRAKVKGQIAKRVSDDLLLKSSNSKGAKDFVIYAVESWAGKVLESEDHEEKYQEALKWHDEWIPHPSDTHPLEKAASALIGQWAYTSADHDNESLSMQMAASEEFGLELNNLKERLTDPESKYYVAGAQDSHKQHGDMHREFLRSQYEDTQNEFRKRGLGPDDPVTLYRGMKVPQATPSRASKVDLGFGVNAGDDEGAIGEHEIKMQPMSSWSSSASVASGFAESKMGYKMSSVVFAANIPTKDILSTSRTGFGCLAESEVVVLGRDATAQVWLETDKPMDRPEVHIGLANKISELIEEESPSEGYARRLQSASYARRLNREFTGRGFYAKFDESKVKRDKDGKFATKSGSGFTGDSPAAKMLRADEEARKKALENQRAWDELQAAEAKAKADAEKAKAEAKKKFWSVKRDSTPTVNAVRNLEKTQQLLMDDLIDIVNEELDKKGRVTAIRIGGSETEVVDERMAELKTALWGSTAGHDSLMDRIPELSDTARVYAKKAVNARLTDRMMPAAIKFYSSADDFMESAGRRRFFDNEEDIREHVERVVRDWVDQWAATSGKGPEAIALQLAALEEFDLGEDERFSIVDTPEWSWDESRERSPHIHDWTDDELHDNFDMYETISKLHKAIVRPRGHITAPKPGEGFFDKVAAESPSNDPTRLGFVDTANNWMASIADGNGEWLEPPYSPAGFRVPQKIPTTKFEFDEAIEFLVEVRQSISDSSRRLTDAGWPHKWHDASPQRRTDLLRSEIEHIDSPEREEFLDNPPGHTAKGVDHLSGARFKHYAYAIHTMFSGQIEALMDLRDLGNRPPETEMDEETREDPDRMPTEEEAWHMSMQGIANRASYAGFDAADIWRGVGHLKKEYTSTLKLLAQVPKPLPGSSEQAAWIKAKREAEKGLADLAKYPDRPDERATSNYPAAAEKIFNTVIWASQDKETGWSKEKERIRANAANARNKDIKEAQKIASDKTGSGPMMRAFVRAQYDETQEKLASAGYEPDDTIALYRGMNFSDEQMPEALKGGSPEFTESETVQSAMSSYSMNFNEAMSFAVRGSQNSAMAAAHVPVGSILSLPTTGVGCLTEGEVVVLRNDGKKYISVSEGGDPARDEMYENYLGHLRQNWEGPTGQRLDNGHGDDLVPDRHGDTPAWYSRSR